MTAIRRTGCTVASSLVTVLMVFCVSQVHTLPCENRANTQLAKIVCFVTASNEHYDYDSLRTGLCSHIVLIDLMGVGKDGSLELLQTSSRSLNRFTRLKRRFRSVGDQAKFIVSIGGVAQKSSHFSKALKTMESRYALSDELISFASKHKLNGLDIAWFYPAQFGGAESDRTNLVVFLRELYLRTKACGISLSITAGVDPKDIEVSYDVPGLNEVVDFVNLLTGDYHNPTCASHISPLYGQGPRDRLNINYSVMSYIDAGLNPRKIVIMSSCYAYLYISKINKEDAACPIKLRTVMRLSYLSARELIIRECFHTSWDDMRQVPYGSVTKGVTKKWITYNDMESSRRKADYALHYQLGGIGLFSVDEDDYDGRAGYGRYPILRSIVAVIYPELGCVEEETEELVETIVCPYTGYLADPAEPEWYYVCQEGVNLHDCPKQRCPQGETFCEAQHSCHHPVVVPPDPEYTTYYTTVEPTVSCSSSGFEAMDSKPSDVVTVVQEHPKSSLILSHQQAAVNVEPTTNRNDIQYTGHEYQASTMAPTVVHVNPSMMALPSTVAPVFASMDDAIPEASHIVPQIVITPNSGQDSMMMIPDVEIYSPGNPLPTPCALNLQTEATILITPKANYTRTSKKMTSSHSRKKKGRSRSTSSRTTSTEVSTVSTTSETTSTTTVESTTTTPTTTTITTSVSTTTTSEPSTEFTTSAETTLPTATKTTSTEEPSTTITSDSSAASTVDLATTSTVETTTASAVDTSTTSTMTSTEESSTVTTFLSTTSSSDETCSDKTSTITTSTVPSTVSNTWVTTTTATTNVSSTKDVAHPALLVTTVT